jgi:copper homeostasis protein
MVMIRPRVGDFSLSDSELATAIGDVKAAQRAGAEGVVFGLLDSGGVIDAPRTRRLVEAAGDLQTVFHRAVDFTPDPVAAVDTLADLGFTRVLTSGGAPRAIDALDVIGQMVKRSQGRIQILPGGGVRAGNVSRVVAETGCDQVHLGPSMAIRNETLRGLQLSDISLLSDNGHRVLDAQAVCDAVRAAADYSRL